MLCKRSVIRIIKIPVITAVKMTISRVHKARPVKHKGHLVCKDSTELVLKPLYPVFVGLPFKRLVPLQSCNP